MNTEQLEKRKKIIYEFICDELYVPMKIKEIAIVLSVPKDQRAELQEVLDALIADGPQPSAASEHVAAADGCHSFLVHPLTLL